MRVPQNSSNSAALTKAARLTHDVPTHAARSTTHGYGTSGRTSATPRMVAVYISINFNVDTIAENAASWMAELAVMTAISYRYGRNFYGCRYDSVRSYGRGAKAAAVYCSPLLQTRRHVSFGIGHM